MAVNDPTEMTEWPDHCPAPPHLRRLANQVQSLAGEVKHFTSIVEPQIKEIAEVLGKLTSMDGPIADIRTKVTEFDARLSDGDRRFEEVQKAVNGEEKRREKADDTLRDQVRETARKSGAGTGSLAGFATAALVKLAEILFHMFGGGG